MTIEVLKIATSASDGSLRLLPNRYAALRISPFASDTIIGQELSKIGHYQFTITSSGNYKLWQGADQSSAVEDVSYGGTGDGKYILVNTDYSTTAHTHTVFPNNLTISGSLNVIGNSSITGTLKVTDGSQTLTIQNSGTSNDSAIYFGENKFRIRYDSTNEVIKQEYFESPNWIITDTQKNKTILGDISASNLFLYDTPAQQYFLSVQGGDNENIFGTTDRNGIFLGDTIRIYAGGSGTGNVNVFGFLNVRQSLSAGSVSANSITGNITNTKYKVYTALLEQSGTSAPIAATILENTIGNIVWSRESIGYYVGTMSITCNAGLVFVQPLRNGIDDTMMLLDQYFINDNKVHLYFRSFTDESRDLNNNNSIPIEIRVYN